MAVPQTCRYESGRTETCCTERESQEQLAACKTLAIFLCVRNTRTKLACSADETLGPNLPAKRGDLVEAHRLQPGDEDDGGRVDREDQSGVNGRQRTFAREDGHGELDEDDA